MFVNFFSEYLIVYQIMWKNILQLDRPQMTIWRVHIACWIPKATNTHTHNMQYSLLFHYNNVTLHVQWLSGISLTQFPEQYRLPFSLLCNFLSSLR